MRGDNHDFLKNGSRIFLRGGLDVILIKRSDLPVERVPKRSAVFKPVIASEAKQSRIAPAALDCFVADAPRNDRNSDRRSSFNHRAAFLCAAHKMSESQILNANPLCKNFRQGA
jgi:hypothetical protein